MDRATDETSNPVREGPVSRVSRRRRVDWPIILGPLGTGPPTPRVANRTESGRLAALLSAFDEIRALDDPDAILRRAVELARERIGLARVGVLLLDASRNLMLGSWGTDLRGALVDEHHIMYTVNDTDREAFRRAQEDGAHFTVFDDCPIVEHGPGETRVAGRGWVACTPVRSPRVTIGMMFNDAGMSGACVDEVQQAHAALLCSMLGALLDPIRGLRGMTGTGTGESPARRLISSVAALLAQDPTIAAREIARQLQVSLGRLARAFDTEVGMSLVEYRNRLRLVRFDVLLAEGRTNLFDAALAAGFGSYAQFHRVFRALRGMTPREHLKRRVRTISRDPLVFAQRDGGRTDR